MRRFFNQSSKSSNIPYISELFTNQEFANRLAAYTKEYDIKIKEELENSIVKIIEKGFEEVTKYKSAQGSDSENEVAKFDPSDIDEDSDLAKALQVIAAVLYDVDKFNKNQAQQHLLKLKISNNTIKIFPLDSQYKTPIIFSSCIFINCTFSGVFEEEKVVWEDAEFGENNILESESEIWLKDLAQAVNVGKLQFPPENEFVSIASNRVSAHVAKNYLSDLIELKELEKNKKKLETTTSEKKVLEEEILELKNQNEEMKRNFPIHERNLNKLAFIYRICSSSDWSSLTTTELKQLQQEISKLSDPQFYTAVDEINSDKMEDEDSSNSSLTKTF